MTCTRKQLITALQALRDLYDHSNHWTKGVLARDSAGNQIGPWSDFATCWCLSGGIALIAKRLTPEDASSSSLAADITKAVKVSAISLYPDQATANAFGIGCLTVPAFNDHPNTTIEDIRKVIEHAIKTAQTDAL